MATKRKRGPRKNPEDKSKVVSMSIAKRLEKAIGLEYEVELKRLPIKKSSFMSYLLNLGLEEHKKRKKK